MSALTQTPQLRNSCTRLPPATGKLPCVDPYSQSRMGWGLKGPLEKFPLNDVANLLIELVTEETPADYSFWLCWVTIRVHKILHEQKLLKTNIWARTNLKHYWPLVFWKKDLKRMLKKIEKNGFFFNGTYKTVWIFLAVFLFQATSRQIKWFYFTANVELGILKDR